MSHLSKETLAPAQSPGSNATSTEYVPLPQLSSAYEPVQKTPSKRDDFGDGHAALLSSSKTQASLDSAFLDSMTAQDMRRKKQIRFAKFITRFLSLAFGTFSMISMIVVLTLFFKTVNVTKVVPVPPGASNNATQTADGTETRGPWHAEPQIWPTVVLFCTSSVSWLAEILVLIMYLVSVERANKVSWFIGKWGYVIFVGHLVVWIGTAVAYRVGKNGSDLWGWSCTPEAGVIQPEFAGVVNFSLYCSIQTASWGVSIAEVIVSLFSLIIFAMSYHRMKHRRLMHQNSNSLYEYEEESFSKRVLPGARKTGLGYIAELVSGVTHS